MSHFNICVFRQQQVRATKKRITAFCVTFHTHGKNMLLCWPCGHRGTISEPDIQILVVVNFFSPTAARTSSSKDVDDRTMPQAVCVQQIFCRQIKPRQIVGNLISLSAIFFFRHLALGYLRLPSDRDSKKRISGREASSLFNCSLPFQHMTIREILGKFFFHCAPNHTVNFASVLEVVSHFVCQKSCRENQK